MVKVPPLTSDGRSLKPQGAVLGTEVRPAAEAPRASAARNAGAGDDPIARPDTGDLAANGFDATDELMTEDDTGAAQHGAP